MGTGRKWYGYLAILAAALSLWSFVSHFVQLPASNVFLDILQYYRHLFHPIAALIGSGIDRIIYKVFGHHLIISSDLIILYLLGAGCMYRMSSATDAKYDNKSSVGLIEGVIDNLFIAIFWPFVVVIFPITTPFILFILIRDELRGDGLNYRRRLRGLPELDDRFVEVKYMLYGNIRYIGEVLVVFIVFLVFVALNAAGLSLF